MRAGAYHAARAAHLKAQEARLERQQRPSLLALRQQRWLRWGGAATKMHTLETGASALSLILVGVASSKGTFWLLAPCLSRG